MALIYSSPCSTTTTATTSISIPHPHRPLKRPSSTSVFFCHSSASKTSSPSSSQLPAIPNNNNNNNNGQIPSSPSSSSSSLADQLLRLSLPLLTSQPTSTATALPPPSKPTWVNPSKPRPSVLSLSRHTRRPFSHNPSLRPLSQLSRSPDLPSALSAAFPPGHPPSRDDALLLLNLIRPWHRSLQFLQFLKSLPDFSLDTIFYNVVLKSLRSAHQWPHVERLAAEMIDASIPLNNITYSTIITAAKRCRRFDDALSWFERMYRTGLMPDEVTYCAVLDVYAQMGRREEVLALYDRARASGWCPDPVAISVLGKMFGEAGDYDGIRYVLKEMKDVGVKPNVVVYNTLIKATGKAGKPGLSRSLFEEMVAAGLSPNEKTLTSLLKIYGKARWSRDALELWGRMKANRWPMDFILYNTLLKMCADLGLEDEAEKLFDDMKRPERYVRPDNWTYTAMINIYGSAGNPDRAMQLFEEMLQIGVEPSVMSCTCLIQCLGKAGRIEDAVKVFDTEMERGIRPDDRLCGCLLSVVALCKVGEMEMVLNCLDKANGRLGGMVRMLGDGRVRFDKIKDEFRGIMNEAAVEVRQPFCNCLIDVCRNQGFPRRRANELLYLGTLYGLYPGLLTRKTDEWSLNLRSLSIGAAKTAFEEWMKSLSSSVEEAETLPQSYSINTGSGTHKLSQGLACSFTEHLEKLAAPFQQNGEKSGSFVASKEDLVSWLQSTYLPAIVNS